MANSLQVPNPISRLSGDNNGFAIQVPQIPTMGTTTVNNAYLVMGIGTKSNNIPSGATALPLDAYGCFPTNFAGQNLTISLIDSGSDDYSFPSPADPVIPACSFSLDSQTLTMFCLPTPTTYSAVISGASGGPQLTLNFQLINGQSAWLDPVNTVFSDIGEPSTDGTLPAVGSAVSQIFDWGLPVFFGKTIYFGMDSATVPGLGAGPFNAL